MKNGTCPSQKQRGAVSLSQESIISAVYDSLPGFFARTQCGAGVWKRIAYLNMSDRSQQCPSAWREINANGIRGCGRPNTLGTSCSPVFFSPASFRLEYRNVCRRVIGYEYGSADGFLNRWNNRTLDSAYVYGVSITHGTPRNHIWTNAAGLTEGRYFDKSVNCPCAHPTHPMNSAIPSLFCRRQLLL